MKKILLVLGLLLCLTGCNRQIVDLNYAYDYAIIDLGSEVRKVKIKSWRDYEDGDQIQVTTEDGTVYLLHSVNVTLVKGDFEDSILEVK